MFHFRCALFVDARSRAMLEATTRDMLRRWRALLQYETTTRG